MTLGRLTFRIDDLARTFDDVALWLYHLDGDTADWNLGGGSAPWLSGLASPSPGAIAAPTPVDRTFEVELRSIDEAIEALTGRPPTAHYPVDGALAAALRVRHDGEVAHLALDVELDWDVYPLPARPPDYRRRRLRVEGAVPIRSGTGA